MKNLARLFYSAGIAIVVASCTSVDGPAPAVSITLANIAPNAADRTAGFDFTVANSGSAAAYIPACSGVPRPDIALDGPGNAHDQISGAICIASLSMAPYRLASGEAYSGHGSVAQRPGVRYTVMVTYTLQPNGGEVRSAAAPAFVVP